jgi:tetratricopeptide (TPR) repeat protein
MYSARDVAEIVGLQESRVRYWAQTGFVGPSARSGGRALYTFEDLIGVKAAKELLERGVSMQRARKSLEALRAQLPHLRQPVARLRVLSDGERVVVIDEGAPFEPLSGQLVMDFATEPLTARASEVTALPPAKSALEWFLDGTRLDEDPDHAGEARAAYERALAADPDLAAAHTNLGNLLHRMGDADGARAHYEAALALDGEQPEARFNLGNLYEELGLRERAVAEWARVVAADPMFADAHYNLAAAMFADGVADAARVHLRRYLELDGAGAWAVEARRLLAQLS